MKIAILGDTHFGMRADSVQFHEHYRNFYENVFFPYLENNNIKTIIQLGDLFDRRKYINFNSLKLCRGYFFDRLAKDNIKFYTLLGNHDIFYKNTLEVNSPELCLSDYSNITIFKEPATVEFDGLNIDFIPWICEENELQIRKFMSSSNSSVCLGHFEISGFEMDAGVVCNDGVDKNLFNKYDVTLSGHFHHKSTDGSITYVGTPGEMTWSDYNEKRGFHIFDTDNRSLEFFQNPYRIFHKIVYDDRNLKLEQINPDKFQKYKDTMVKVVVAHKSNPVIYDTFVDLIYKSGTLDLSIVEDFIDYSQISDEDIIDQSEDTLSILDKYVDGVDVELDKTKMKVMLREIYMQAQNFEG